MYTSFLLSISKILDTIEITGKALFLIYKKLHLKQKHHCIIKLSQVTRTYYPLSNTKQTKKKHLMLGKFTSGGLEPSLEEGRDGRAWKVKERSKRMG